MTVEELRRWVLDDESYELPGEEIVIDDFRNVNFDFVGAFDHCIKMMENNPKEVSMKTVREFLRYYVELAYDRGCMDAVNLLKVNLTNSTKNLVLKSCETCFKSE